MDMAQQPSVRVEAEVLYDRLKKDAMAVHVDETQTNTKDNEVSHVQCEVLYDRLERKSIAEVRGKEKHDKSSNNAKKQRKPGPAVLPFTFEVDELFGTPMRRYQPYLERIMSGLPKNSIPPNLQSIIIHCDFEKEDTSSKLYDVVRLYIPHCNVMLTEKAKAIRRDLTDTVSKCLHKLRETNLRVFHGVTAVLLGSAEEGTRAFLPDEWDFVIFLPFLWMEYQDRFPLTNESEPFRMETETIAELELELLGIKTKQSYYSDPKKITDKLREHVTEAFQSVCQGVTLRHACNKHKALALTVALDEFDIKMDVSFGMRDESRAPTFTDSMLVRSLEEQPPNGFYILPGFVFQTTFTFKEVKYMHNLPQKVRLCYQLAKCLIEHCLPQYSLLCRCRRTLFPSFWLKQLLFYLSQYYDCDRFWSEGQLSSRLIELFVIYNMCLRYGVINHGLPDIERKGTGIGHYMYITDEEDTSYLNILESEVAQCLEKISSFSDTITVAGMFKAYFSEREDDRIVFNGDLVSAFCVVLGLLKQSNMEQRGVKEADPAPEITSSATNRGECSSCEINTELPIIQAAYSTKSSKFQVLQFITMEGGIECMFVSPHHDGEIVIATSNPYYQQPWLIKYKCNEIIQTTALPYITCDMCYINKCIVITFEDNRIITYGYDDFAQKSSFETLKRCVGVTNFADGSIACLYLKDGVVKSTLSGEVLASSRKTFRIPLHIVTIRTQDTVAVSDFGDHSIIGLSNDLQTITFVFKRGESVRMTHVTHILKWGGEDKDESDKLYPRLICWNDENKTIMVCQDKHGANLELTEKGHVIREFEISLRLNTEKSLNNSMCYDENSRRLMIAEAIHDRIAVYSKVTLD